MILYHGSNLEIATIDLEKCKPFKDFGKGFYLTSIDAQAREMAYHTTRIYGGTPTVTEYEFDESILTSGDFNVRQFPEIPTVEWAVFIHNNRWRDNKDISSLECNRDAKYDIVIGPVADDKVALTIRLYMRHVIDLEGLKSQLTYRKLTNQYSFHTQEAISKLKKVGVCNV